jgi:hypothetical protein
MDEKSRKMAAALAAVSQYLDEEAAARVLPPPGPPALSLWAVSGRQQIMSARTLIAARLWK